MTLSVDDKLIHMANQIARQFQPHGVDAAAELANHIKTFWTPKMRVQLAERVADGDARLDPVVRNAVRDFL